MKFLRSRSQFVCTRNVFPAVTIKQAIIEMYQMKTYVLDDWIRLWDLDMIRDMDLFDMRHVDFLNVGNWVGNLLDDGHSLLLMMMVVRLLMMIMRLFVMSDFVSEIMAAVAVAVGTEVMASEVMIEQASLVLLFARSRFDGLLLFLSLLLRGNA
jgi:hypothetical protein